MNWLVVIKMLRRVRGNMYIDTIGIWHWIWRSGSGMSLIGRDICFDSFKLMMGLFLR